MDISVIIPLYNEEESLPELYAWIERVMTANGYSFEVIFVNDGSTDRSWQVIETLANDHQEVKGIKFRRNYGKSPACIVASTRLRVMWLSPWTPTCKTHPTRYRPLQHDCK